MKHSLRLTSMTVAFMALTLIAVVSAPASAQGGAASSIVGTVVDASGGLIPGANVLAKNNGTGAEFTAVSSEQGVFTIPAVNPGTYTVTVTLLGFKTAVLNDVIVNAAVPASVRATLEVGGLEETIVVEAASSIVQTTSSAVATTMDINQIANLPLTSRNALDFIPLLAGVNTPGGNRDSTINGLPQSAINITLDGMNVQDNFLKTNDGFFTRLSPRLDAVEEVTVTTAAQGADSAGQGGVQIRFVTRSGTNEFRGSGYHYYRHHSLNANTWFNNRDLPPDPATGKAPKSQLVQNQPGVRVGGPIFIPGLWNGRDRGFFFVNYEEFRQPQDVTRNRTVLHPRAQAGIFRYNVGGQVREVDLLALAARNGHLSTLDPTVAKLLADIRSSTTTTGQVAGLDDPSLQRYTWQVHQRSHNIYPTVRVDFNLSQSHRLTGSWNYQHILSTPDTLNSRDPNFPGFPVHGVQDSDRYTTSNALRSTLGKDLVNELRVGATGGATLFSPGLTTGMWGGTSVADQTGFQLAISTANITNASSGPTPSSREASTKVVEDTLNWIRGSHSVSFGASFTQVDLWLKNQTLVPTIEFDVVTGDPADSMFTTANFPGASSTQLTDAGDLYAVLVGRVSRVVGNAGLDENTGQYVFLGPRLQRGRMREIGLFAQDSWRLRPDFTLNFGLRYELQLPFYATNNSYSTATVEDVWGVSGVGNLFRPGVLEGKRPQFIQFQKGERAYNIDWNNVAPSLGFAWTPAAQNGLFRRLLGENGDTVIRGGYAIAYNRHGMSDFSNVFGANPGVTINATRELAQGNLGALPLLFRDRSRLGPPVIPERPVYPMTDVITEDVNIFEPHLQVPYTQSWQAGIQRAVSRNMAVEVRYVGTRSLQGWTEYDFNEINIVENGFLDEFRRAQANLQANIAAGRGNTFRYFGPGTGTSPLPIVLAYFSGIPASQAGDASRYTSTLFANSAFVNTLAVNNPQPCCSTSSQTPSFAFNLYNNATRRANASRAGLPANFFLVNPDLQGGANITGNGGYTKYNSLQIELRRRLSQGLQFQTSYVYGRAYQSNRYSLRRPRVKVLDTGTEGGVTHALKGNWVYELPFGRGRRFASGVGPVVDRIIGGWTFDGTARIQSGRLLDFGNVRLVGMTVDELRDAFQLRFAENGQVYVLPQDIIDNTVRAFSVSATSPTGYGALGPPSGRYLAPANGPDCIEVAPGFGDCGVRTLVVTGPTFARFDLSVGKRIPIKGRVDFQFRAEMLNAFNHANFAPVTGFQDGTPNDPDDYRITGLVSDPTSRIVQLVTRISW